MQRPPPTLRRSSSSLPDELRSAPLRQPRRSPRARQLQEFNDAQSAPVRVLRNGRVRVTAVPAPASLRSAAAQRGGAAVVRTSDALNALVSRLFEQLLWLSRVAVAGDPAFAVRSAWLAAAADERHVLHLAFANLIPRLDDGEPSARAAPLLRGDADFAAYAALFRGIVAHWRAHGVRPLAQLDASARAAVFDDAAQWLALMRACARALLDTLDGESADAMARAPHNDLLLAKARSALDSLRVDAPLGSAAVLVNVRNLQLEWTARELVARLLDPQHRVLDRSEQQIELVVHRGELDATLAVLHAHAPALELADEWIDETAEPQNAALIAQIDKEIASSIDADAEKEKEEKIKLEL